MKFRLAGAALALAPLAATPAFAQTDLSAAGIVQSLDQLDQAAVGLNAQKLRQMALDNIAAHPGEDVVGRDPLWRQLDSMRQLTVEIDFDLGSATIRPQSYVTIGRIADALHHPYLMQYRFIVIGHTDATGTRAFNLSLSQARAEAVREALVTTFKITPARLEAVGLGEEQMRDPANPYAAVNRRVQLINVGK